MNRFKKAVRARTALPGLALVAAIALVTYGSAAGDSSGTESTGSGPASEAAKPSQATDPGPADRLLALRRTQGVDIVADAIRTVAAPDAEGEAPDWVLAPTRDGGVCADTSRVVFCGTDRASIEAGRASATEYPPDKYLGTDPRTGLEMVKPSDGTGVRSGIAPTQAVEVVVLDRDGRVLRGEAVAGGVYQVVVPAQGSNARVAFVDAAGDTIVTRPAEG